MEITNSCCCCLLRPSDKKLKKPYARSGKSEVYSDILKECFELHFTFLPCDDECGICKVCVKRLRDASDFKHQVQCCQEVLQAQLKEACCVKEEEEESPKVEKLDDCDADPEKLIHVSMEVKTEIVDPLPTDDNEDIELFMPDIKNPASDVCKQEPLLEVPIKHQTPFHYIISPNSCIDEVFDDDAKHELKPKKKRTNRARAQSKNTSYICGTCERQFTCKAALTIHKKTHERPFICEICKKQFKRKSHLNVHKQTHTGVKPYKCEQCNKQFLSKNTLKNHIHTHTGEKRFSCDICNVKYSTKKSLIGHMSVHMNLKIFQCKLCPVTLRDPKSIRTHIKYTHTNQACYTCDECKKVFVYKHEMIKHMNIHYKWTNYPCVVCGSKLSTKASLRRHMVVHTGETPYSCHICTKQFPHKHSLNGHILTHTGERPHCCEVCGKRFAQKRNLKKHLEIHIKGRTYTCELCTKWYSTSEGLRQHRRVHARNTSQAKSVSTKKNKNTTTKM